MKSRLRAGIAAATVLIASYGAVAATNQTASAMRVSPEASKVAEAGSGTELPAGTAGDLIVDDSHSQVFVSMPTINTIVVTNPDGHIQRTVTGVLGPRKMALSPDGSTLYATERS